MNRVMQRKMNQLVKVLSSLPTDSLLLLIHAINTELDSRKIKKGKKEYEKI